MTAKRYFKRMWEEEFYIFDSEIISENDFDERVEYEGYKSFADSMLGEEVVNKLNQLYGENEQLKQEIKNGKSYCKCLETDLGNCADKRIRLQKENEQLKDSNEHFKEWFRDNGITEIVVGDMKVILND